MSMSESTHTAQNGEHAAPEDDGLDWTLVFDNAELDYGHASRMDVIGALILSGQKPEGADENRVFSDAVEAGELESHGGGFHIAGYEPAVPEPEPEPSEDETTDTDFSHEKEVSGSEEMVQLTRSEYEELRETAERADERVETLIQAFGALTGADESGQIVVDELIAQGRSTGKRVDHMSRTISKVSNQLDSLGELQEDKKPTRKGRVQMLRQHLVDKARSSNGKHAMDYNAVQSYFEGKGMDTSASYASNLLSDAAEGHHAFMTRKRDGSNKKVAVDLDKIEEGSFFSVKKDSTGEGA